MDSGLTLRPSAGVAGTASVRPDPQSARTAVATTLAASRSVTAAAGADRSAAHDPAHRAPRGPTTREVVIDPQAREVIYRAIDVRARQVDRQIRDAALRRRRAYARAVAEGRKPPEAHSGTDSAV